MVNTFRKIFDRNSFTPSPRIFESRKENLREKKEKGKKKHTFTWLGPKSRGWNFNESRSVVRMNVRNKAKRQSDF